MTWGYALGILIGALVLIAIGALIIKGGPILDALYKVLFG